MYINMLTITITEQKSMNLESGEGYMKGLEGKKGR